MQFYNINEKRPIKMRFIILMKKSQLLIKKIDN